MVRLEVADHRLNGAAPPQEQLERAAELAPPRQVHFHPWRMVLLAAEPAIHKRQAPHAPGHLEERTQLLPRLRTSAPQVSQHSPQVGAQLARLFACSLPLLCLGITTLLSQPPSAHASR